MHIPQCRYMRGRGGVSERAKEREGQEDKKRGGCVHAYRSVRVQYYSSMSIHAHGPRPMAASVSLAVFSLAVLAPCVLQSGMANYV